MIFMKVTGEKIRQIRLDRGLTSVEIAALVEPRVTRQAWEHWERNGVTTFVTLSKIAKALGVPEKELLEADNG